MGQPVPLTKGQSDAVAAYDAAVKGFKLILGQRRAQLDSKQPLPNLPGQALYLARNGMLSARKDLTDAVPSKIGRPNKFKIPSGLFRCRSGAVDRRVQAVVRSHAGAAGQFAKIGHALQGRCRSGTAIGRARGLDAENADAAGRISLGLFFAETNGNQNIGNARSNKYKGSFQTGPSEDQNGQRKWATIKTSIAAFDPALNLRDDREAARVGNLDHRYNHWTRCVTRS